MKAMEWFLANVTNDQPDEKSRMIENRILALLEEVDAADIDDLRRLDGTTSFVIRAARALKESL